MPEIEIIGGNTIPQPEMPGLPVASNASVRKRFAASIPSGTLRCMSEELRLLVERAKRLQPSREDAEEQRRSFAYGNLKLEDDRRCLRYRGTWRWLSL